MRKLLRRTFSVAFLAGVMVLLMTATALAFSCTPVNKPIGAGVAGSVTLDVVAGTFTETGMDLNPAGNMKGNFVTVSVVAGDVLLDEVDIWWRKDLPEGAHNSGPGDTECDGVGIDDAAECGP
jgi:hypothetical protein